MKKLLALLCAFGLICGLGLSTTGCGKKEEPKKTADKTATATDKTKTDATDKTKTDATDKTKT